MRTFETHSRTDRLVAKFSGVVNNLKSTVTENGLVRLAFTARTDDRGQILGSNETHTPDVLMYDRFWVRIWDQWVMPHRSVIFSATLRLSGGRYELIDSPYNILNSTAEQRLLECPSPLGGGDDFSLSNISIAFVARDPRLNPAFNTASHIYIARYSEPSYLLKVNHGSGASSSPSWSPDGKFLAFLEQRIPGHGTDSNHDPFSTNYRISRRGV